MIKLIALKDFLLNLTSARFILGFLICLFIIPFTLIISIDKYKDQLSIYEITQKKADDDLKYKKNRVYSFVRPVIVSKPQALSIFNQGINNNFGTELKIKIGEYPLFMSGQINTMDNPFLHRFSTIDFSSVIAIIMSLFALVFSYDSFSRENENGSLKMILVNKVNRSTFFIGKFCGILITILPILLFSFLLSILILILSPSISFSTNDWIGIFILFISSIVYIIVFILLGMFISSMVNQSSTSIIVSMLLWIWFLFMMPSIASYAAKNFVKIDLYDNVKYVLNGIDGELKKESNEKSQELMKQFNIDDGLERWNSWFDNDGGISTFGPQSTGEFYSLYSPWEFNRLVYYADKKWHIQKEYYNSLIRQENTRNRIAMLSPSEIFLQLSSSLCQTDTDNKMKYMDNIREYRASVIKYFEENKLTESPLWFTPFGLEALTTMNADYEELEKNYKGIDLENFPEFSHNMSPLNLSKIVFLRLSMLLLLGFIVLIATIIRFQKYQVKG